MLQDELLTFFKALADANRLKILGLLAGQDLTVEQLAELLDLRASTVSHHLSRLSEAGLVSARAESYYNIYHLETKEIETIAKQLLSEDTLPAIASDVDLDAYDRKVVSGYTTPDGRLKTIPSQRKKLEAVLGYIVQAFKPGMTYSEREVNQILSRFHDDTATLRRELVGFGLLERAGGGGEYWRVEQDTMD
jgi:predicted transcriptional regulator